MHGSKYGNWALNKSDVIVCAGARFDDRVTGKLSAFAPGATVIHLDIDAAEVGKLRHADFPSSASGARARRAGGPGANPQRADRTPPRGLAPSARRVEGAVPLPLCEGDESGVKPQLVLETLRDLTAGRDDMIWTTGVGQHQMWAMQYVHCDRPRTFITSGGLGTMGYGLPAAVGAKAARPEATVVNVDGDGCFQMTCQELATSVLEGLPVVTVILNNGWLGWCDSGRRCSTRSASPRRT